MVSNQMAGPDGTTSVNLVTKLNLSFQNIKDFTYLPNYKNLVEKRITKVEIDLSGSGLEEIPESVFKLRELKKLSMGFNLLSSWDDVPMKLSHLMLNNNRIHNITGYVTQMKFLVLLDLSNNIISTISPLHLCKSLKYLLLENNKVSEALTKLSSVKDLSCHQSLVEADFSNNLIEEQSEILLLNKCSSLEVLCISGNSVLK